MTPVAGRFEMLLVLGPLMFGMFLGLVINYKWRGLQFHDFNNVQITVYYKMLFLPQHFYRDEV